MSTPLLHGRCVGRDPVQKILAYNEQGNTGRTKVLLGSGVDHCEFFVIDFSCENIRAHVCYQWDIVGHLWDVMPLGTVQCVVGGDVCVGYSLAELDILWHVRESFFLRGRDDSYISKEFSLLDGLGGPASGVDILHWLARHLQV